MKVAIAIFSTFSGNGYKASQIREMIDKFESDNIGFNCYAIGDTPKYVLKRCNNIIFSGLPLWVYSIYNKLHLTYPRYYNYLISEIIYGSIFKRSIIKDDSSIVILKNRPLHLIKSIKKKTNKKIIIEADQLHPFFTQKILLQEYKKFNIKSSSIYTNKWAVIQYAKAFNYADAIVVYNERQKNILEEYGVQSKIFVNELGIDNHFDSSKVNECRYSSEKEFLFISYANHSFVKGTHLLIDIWQKMSRENKLIIAGPLEGDLKNFLKERPSLISPNIKFISSFNLNNLYDLSLEYNLIGIAPSLSESYNRVVSEFIELKIPVIVSQVIDRDVSKHKLGYVVNVFNEEEFVSALRKIIEPTIYQSFQKNIDLIEFRRYSDFAKQYISIIKSVISK